MSRFAERADDVSDVVDAVTCDKSVRHDSCPAVSPRLGVVDQNTVTVVRRDASGLKPELRYVCVCHAHETRRHTYHRQGQTSCTTCSEELAGKGAHSSGEMKQARSR